MGEDNVRLRTTIHAMAETCAKQENIIIAALRADCERWRIQINRLALDCGRKDKLLERAAEKLLFQTWDKSRVELAAEIYAELQPKGTP